MRSVFLSIILWLAPSWSLLKAQEKSFSAVFSDSKVAFSGTFDSKEKLEKIARTLVEAVPSLRVVNFGMVYNNQNLANLVYLENLLVEIAISTHEGELKISDHEIIIGGLTDSAVTPAAIRLRAATFVNKKRKLRDLICLVPTTDLPNYPVRLSTGENRTPQIFDLDLIQIQKSGYEPPGIDLMKLGNLLTHTENIYWLETSKLNPPPSQDLAQKGLSPAKELPGGVLPKASLPLKQPHLPESDLYLAIGQIEYGSNSAFLDTSEEQHLNSLAEKLNTEPTVNQPIELIIMDYRLGSRAFSDWVATKRKTKTIEQLVANGVDKQRLKVTIKKSEKANDAGEVFFRVLKSEE